MLDMHILTMGAGPYATTPSCANLMGWSGPSLVNVYIALVWSGPAHGGKKYLLLDDAVTSLPLRRYSSRVNNTMNPTVAGPYVTASLDQDVDLPTHMMSIYLFIYLFFPPALNPKSYRVLEAPSRPMLVIGRSFYEGIVVIVGNEITEYCTITGLTEPAECEITGDETEGLRTTRRTVRNSWI